MDFRVLFCFLNESINIRCRVLELLQPRFLDRDRLTDTLLLCVVIGREETELTDTTGRRILLPLGSG